MKHYKYAFAAVVALACTACATAHATGDSLRYLLPGDTVMLRIDADQGKFTEHVFAPQQTVYSLARFYGQDLDQVYRLNPALAQAGPDIGDTVEVGVPNFAITRFRRTGFSASKFAPVCYAVQPGETMYKIAKTVFRMPVDSLLALNRLTGTTLSPGQVLQVGWIPLGGVGDQVQPQRIDPLMRVNYLNFRHYTRGDSTARVEPHRGVATWTEGTGESSGSLFALSDEAEVGAILKVTNAANNKVAYVRVIGRSAANAQRDRVDLQLSGTAARVLGATERNFYVLIE